VAYFTWSPEAELRVDTRNYAPNTRRR
jgi:hypothetical protein